MWIILQPVLGQVVAYSRPANCLLVGDFLIFFLFVSITGYVWHLILTVDFSIYGLILSDLWAPCTVAVQTLGERRAGPQCRREPTSRGRARFLGQPKSSLVSQTLGYLAHPIVVFCPRRASPRSPCWAYLILIAQIFMIQHIVMYIYKCIIII